MVEQMYPRRSAMKELTKIGTALYYIVKNKVKNKTQKRGKGNMIKNIVFDVGQVLMSYTPENYLKNLGFSEKTVQTLRKAIFESTLWEAGDRGIISTEEIWEGFRKNVPGLKKEVQTVYDNLGDVVELMPYAEDWVKTLKEQGYHLYILSNYAEHTYQLSSHKMKFLPYMDGTLFSYVYKMAKPDREIYEKLCTMYQLNPRETVFFDDREDNIAGAGACGIHGILFQNHEQAKKDLETLLKRENGK